MTVGLQEQHLRTHCSWKALLRVPLVLPSYAHLLELQRCCFLSQLLTYLSRPSDLGMFISKPCAEPVLRNCLGKGGRKEGRKKETIPPPSLRSQIPAQAPPSGLRPQLSCQSREHTGSKEPPGQTVPPPPPSSPASYSLVWRGNIARRHSAPAPKQSISMLLGAEWVLEWVGEKW